MLIPDARMDATSPTRKAATWRDSSGVPATASRADVSTRHPQQRARPSLCGKNEQIFNAAPRLELAAIYGLFETQVGKRVVKRSLIVAGFMEVQLRQFVARPARAYAN